MREHSAFLLLLLLLFSLQACKAASSKGTDKPVPSFRHDGYLKILSASGETKAQFDIEIVSKDAELAQGLKFRESMAENQAMFFIFEYVDYHSFWMQDTYMSLDMLFIDSSGTIITIAENTPPFSEQQIVADKPNKYVLELLAGTAQRLNLKETDTVSWHYKED